MKKQIILNISDDGYYIGKLLLCALHNREKPKKLNQDIVEVIINCSKTVEQRLDIPSLKYTNEQIKMDSKVFISFPFEKPVFIAGDNVFTVNKQSDFKTLMMNICNYLHIKVDLAYKSLFKQYLLTAEYTSDIVVKVRDNKICLTNADFFSDVDLVNLIALTTTPTLELAKIIKADVYGKETEMMEVISEVENLPQHEELNDIGRELLLFRDIKLLDDRELNENLFKVSSDTNEYKNILTTVHIINMLIYNVVYGECPYFKLPEKDGINFIL